MADSIFDLVIVGGGPAGLTAAVYAARKQLRTMLISGDIGGQVNNTWGVENYMGYQFIGGPDLVDKFHEQVTKFPIEQKIGQKVTEIRHTGHIFTVITSDGSSFESKTVIFASRAVTAFHRAGSFMIGSKAIWILK